MAESASSEQWKIQKDLWHICKTCPKCPASALFSKASELSCQHTRRDEDPNRCFGIDLGLIPVGAFSSLQIQANACKCQVDDSTLS